LNIEKIDISVLIPYARNARTHSDEQIAQIAGSIKEFGFNNPVLIDKDNGVIAGHGRLAAARKLGLKEVPCIRLEHLTETQRKAYILADNRIALNSGWEAELLSLELSELLDGGVNLESLGFDADEIDALLNKIEPTEGLTDEDATPEVPEEPVTKPGDVWILGKHRLMCGDSTSIDAVDKLMAGVEADMVYCDPPYGMALDTDYSKIKGSSKSPNAKGYKWDKVIGDDHDFDPSVLIEFFKGAREQFWWGADYYFECLPRGGSLLVWQKRDKADAEMIGNDFEICWSRERHKKATFWKRWVGFDSIERGEKRVHPTQKPIDLHCWIFDKWGKSNDVVVDLFGGSGSTLIACEKTGRVNRSMELDPKYCDVIVKRWQDFTGKQATLESTGQIYSELTNKSEIQNG
jgi:DNA modification methylase